MAFVSPPIIATGDLVPASEWNANWSYLYDSGWITIPAASSGYTNSWVSSDGPASGATVAGLRKIGNVVRLGGSIASGVSGAAICTLIAAYRPAYRVRCTGVSAATSTTVWMCDIVATGVMTPVFSGGAQQSLDGVTYTID